MVANLPIAHPRLGRGSRKTGGGAKGQRPTSNLMSDDGRSIRIWTWRPRTKPLQKTLRIAKRVGLPGPSAPPDAGDLALEYLERVEEGFPVEPGLIRLDVVEAVAEDGRCLPDRDRERLLPECNERTTGPVLRPGDRHRSSEATTTDLFDRPVKLVEQGGIHQPPMSCATARR